MSYLYNKYILMSTLSRSNTVVNGEIRDKGKSGIQTQRDIYNQRLPVAPGDLNARTQSLMDGDKVHGRWALNRNTGQFEGTLSEYAAGEERLVRGAGKRHRPSRKYKKSAKRVFRKKSRATRRR
jgi:hypothetical protein